LLPPPTSMPHAVGSMFSCGHVTARNTPNRKRVRTCRGTDQTCDRAGSRGWQQGRRLIAEQSEAGEPHVEQEQQRLLRHDGPHDLRLARRQAQQTALQALILCARVAQEDNTASLLRLRLRLGLRLRLREVVYLRLHVARRGRSRHVPAASLAVRPRSRALLPSRHRSRPSNLHRRQRRQRRKLLHGLLPALRRSSRGRCSLRRRVCVMRGVHGYPA
jgi:hypothetical protein